jgi:ketosteroid isomerase-like protein
MRKLVLVAALATAAACRDGAAPDAPDPSRSEASTRAHLDLREERAELIDAGDQVSAAIQANGVAAGLGAALADDALLLSPRVNIVQGHDAAVAFLTSNPVAPSALDWTIFAADVSNDGTQGFTWGQGGFTINIGTGPLQLPALFLTYWRRAAAGDDWRIAAMTIANAGPHEGGIPAGFGTPDTKHRRHFPNTEVAGQREAIRATDAAFSAASVANGSGPAFEQFAAPNAIAVSGDLFFGPADIGAAFTSAPGDVISWIPRFADVAASGDLGFSVGEATFDFADGSLFFSKYLTVWQKQNTGEWRYVADLGNSRPSPAQ